MLQLAGRVGQDALDQICGVLLGGGVVLLPTDTVYGLAVHPTRDDAVARLFAMKRRPRGRNLPIMVASVAQLDELGAVMTDEARRLMEAFLPGPLSVALGLRPGDAPSWLSGRVEIAIRIPADEQLLDVLAVAGPLLVTSANISDEATPPSVEEILAMLDGRPDAGIDGGSRLGGVPSTLVNCNLPTPVIERVGAISSDEIVTVLR